MAVEVRGLLSDVLGASSTSALVNQDRTILGPLTTTFTPPASCTLAATSSSDEIVLAYIAKTCNGLGDVSDATACWPSTSKGAPKPSASFDGWGFYSPGVVCPAGYATACLATGGESGTSNWDVQFTLSAGETAAGCCPSGYTCGNNGGQTCSQVISTGTVPTLSCPLLGTDAKTGAVTISDRSDDIATMTLFAPMIQINWQSSDRVAPSTSAQTSPSSTQPLQTSTPSSKPVSESLSGTQIISTDSSASGTLEVAPSTSVIQVSSSGLGPIPVSTAIVTATAAAGASSGDSSSSSGSDTTTTNEQSSDSGSGKAKFPVAATIGISVAGGLGAFAVSIWACFMYQRRRRYRKDMLQGISDDRMLQQLDNMYESTRPKTFDVIGSEVPYELKRQDTHGSLGGGGGGGGMMAPPQAVYGPGQETARFFRAGPQRSPQFIGNFAGVTSGQGVNTSGVADVGALDPEYDRYYRR